MNANAASGVVAAAVSAPKSTATVAPKVAPPSDKEPKALVAERGDDVELSESSRFLQASVAQSEARPKEPPVVAAKRPASQWEQDRMDQIDRLVLLLHKGQYHVEPFMVDEIALRLARQMIHA